MLTDTARQAPENTLRNDLRSGRFLPVDTVKLKQAVLHSWEMLSSHMEREGYTIDRSKLFPSLPESSLSPLEELEAKQVFNDDPANRKVYFSREKTLKNSAGNVVFKHLLERATSSINFGQFSKTQKSRVIKEISNFFNQEGFSFHKNTKLISENETCSRGKMSLVKDKISKAITELDVKIDKRNEIHAKRKVLTNNQSIEIQSKKRKTFPEPGVGLKLFSSGATSSIEDEDKKPAAKPSMNLNAANNAAENLLNDIRARKQQIEDQIPLDINDNNPIELPDSIIDFLKKSQY